MPNNFSSDMSIPFRIRPVRRFRGGRGFLLCKKGTTDRHVHAASSNRTPSERALISLTNYNLRSHSLNEFNNKIRKCVPKLVFFEDDALEEKYLLEQLEYSYSSARYNVAYEVSEERVLVLFEKIRGHPNLAIQNFNAIVASFKNAYPSMNLYEN